MKKYKTEWNLRLLYTSPNDPQIEKDLSEMEKACKRFHTKYGTKSDFAQSARRLQTALRDYFALDDLPGAINPYMYFYFQKDRGNTAPIIDKKLAHIEARMNHAFNDIVFFTIVLKKLGSKKQKELLASPFLADYKYFLKKLFDASKHTLSEAETKILNLKSQPSNSMWVSGVEKALSTKTIRHNGKDISLGEASNIMHDLPTEKRRKLFKQIMEACASLSDFAEAEINAVYTDKKINDDLLNYEKPYSQTIRNYENDEKDIEKFVALVTKSFPIAHRFFKLKKKLLKLPHLTYADRGAKIGSISKKYPFDTGLSIIQNAFSKVDRKYTDIVNDFLKNGQIDVFPNKTKTSGAYCAGNHTTPTMVLLNYVNNLDSITTFAHEMGHAFHSEFSKTQPVQYEDYSIAVAETASTLFENFVFDEVFETLNEKEKIVALHDRIQSTIATIFRQVACFNFELELHTKVREQGYVSADEICTALNKHMSAYLGPAVKMSKDDGYFFVLWSHIRRPFYVYSYAFGELISSALYETYKKNPAFLTKIETFLHAGSSMSPRDMFKKIGIDISDMNFFKQGLKKIEKDIATLEKLVS